MQGEPETRLVSRLNLFEGSERSNIFGRLFVFAPVGEKSAPRVLVDRAFVRLYDVIARGDPAAD